VNVPHRLVGKIVAASGGQSTEVGIRQKSGPDGRSVTPDQFENGQNLGRMRQPSS